MIIRLICFARIYEELLGLFFRDCLLEVKRLRVCDCDLFALVREVSSPFPVSVLNNEVLRIPFCYCCFVRDSAVEYICCGTTLGSEDDL